METNVTNQETAVDANPTVKTGTEVKSAAPAAENQVTTMAEKSQEPDKGNQIREEFEKEKAAAVEAAVKEAVKKAGMQPEEAAKYEDQKRQEELEKKEREINLREMRNDTKDILHEKEIPVSFADFLIGEDMEKTKDHIAAFKKEFDAAVQAQVEQRMKGTTPAVSSGIVGTGTNTMATEIDKYL